MIDFHTVIQSHVFSKVLLGFLSEREEGNANTYSKKLKILSLGRAAIISFKIKRPIRYGTPSSKFKTLISSHPAKPKTSPPKAAFISELLQNACFLISQLLLLQLEQSGYVVPLKSLEMLQKKKPN